MDSATYAGEIARRDWSEVEDFFPQSDDLPAQPCENELSAERGLNFGSVVFRSVINDQEKTAYETDKTQSVRTERGESL